MREAPAFTPTASPRLRRRPSPWPPHRTSKPASELTGSETRPGHALHTGPYPSGLSRHWTYGASDSGSSRTPSHHCLPDPGRLTVPTRPVRCRSCSHRRVRSHVPAAPSFTGQLRPTGGEGLSPPLDSRRLVAHDRFPIDAGRFHPDQRHLLLGQPVREQVELPGHRGERSGLRTPRATRSRTAHRGHHRVPVHIQAGAPLDQHIHPCTPSPSTAGAARSGEPVDQETEVRARSSRSGCLRLPASHFFTGSRHQEAPTSGPDDRADSHPVTGAGTSRHDHFFANARTFREQVRALTRSDPRPRWIIIAAEPITDVDTTAAEMLHDLDVALNEDGVSLVFAEMKDPVRRKVDRYELTRTIDPSHFFPTLDAAVVAFRKETGSGWGAPSPGGDA